MGATGAFAQFPSSAPLSPAPPKPPLDYIDGDKGVYTNSTDLMFYRDLTSLATSTVAGFAAATLTEIYFVKSMSLLVGVSRATQFAGKAHLASAIISFGVGVAVEKGTEEALTRFYHTRYRE